MSQNLLRAALARREFLCTAELVLGRDHATHEAERFVEEAARGQAIRVISVTDLPGGHPALPPEAFVAAIAERGLTPIAHLTGKDGNRSLLEGRLHALARLGVENVLALTGDAQREAFGGLGKPVHDLDSVLILRLIAALREGLHYRVGTRSAESAPFDFFPGAVVNPFKVREPDLMMQLYKLELKIAAGAAFIIPQIGFDLRKLVELRQYMVREGLDHVPVLANLYVATAKIARLMQAGEVAGCVVPDELVRRLEGEKKPQRLERAALMLAAVRELGFAGAHIGGYGLVYADYLKILERADEIGGAWRGRMDELTFPYPGGFYLLPRGDDGLSDPAAPYQLAPARTGASLLQRVSRLAHRHIIGSGSVGSRFLTPRIKPAADAAGPGDADQAWRHGVWPRLLAPSTVYRHSVLGCVDCGDCIQDHLSYAGCSMHYCYKELRNGPCGGARPDGSCEVHPDRPCLWGLVYEATRAAGEDPRRFAHVLIPPRDWRLSGTNALANRYADIDNVPRRIELDPARGPAELPKES